MPLHTTLIEQLKNAGHRMTTTRREIIILLSECTAPITAMELLAQLKKRHRAVNKTTVYRELDFLQTQQLIHVVQFGDGHKHFELAETEHHHHLRCMKCERVEDVHVDNELRLAERQIRKKSRFKIMNHSLEFFGLCVQCQ